MSQQNFRYNGIKIAVIGPGALGTLFAARLGLAGTPTLLIDYRNERAAALQQNGVHVTDREGARAVNLPVSANPSELSNVDVALVLVKSYQTEEVAHTLAEYLSPSAVAVSLQNGLGNVETLQLHLGADRVFGGTTAQGALLESPGVVRDTGGGPTFIGSYAAQPDPRLDDFCQALLLAGFAVSITKDLAATLWDKVILNAALNPVGALTRMRNGELAQHEPSLKVMVAAAREAFTVARAHGIHVEEQDWRARLEVICFSTRENVNSMLSDVLARRRTEIDVINGAIIRYAEQHDILVPVNRTLCYLLQAIEQGYTKVVECA